ncbi:MAG: FecR domain-containing protein [Bacteroidota bacterium]
MKDFREAIADYLEGKGDEKHASLLDAWLKKESNNMHTLQYTYQKLQKSAKYAENYQPNTTKAYDEILLKIKSTDSIDNNVVKAPKRMFFNNINFSRIAAFILLLIVATISFLYYTANLDSTQWKTLKSTNLNEEIVLADGSRVWLNSSSSLKYPVNFASSTRNVEVNGEAFFEVAHIPNKPFIIKTAANSEIKVAGTALNVRCYEHEAAEEIAVLNGSVVYGCPEDTRTPVTLKNGQCVIRKMDSGSVEMMNKIDPNVFTWKDHILTFENANCLTFEKALERYFNITVEIKDSALYNCHFSALFKNESLQEILDFVSKETNIKSTVNGDTCYLWGKACETNSQQ